MGKPTRIGEYSQILQIFSHGKLISLTTALRTSIVAAVVPRACAHCDRDTWLRTEGVRMTLEADLDNLETVMFARAVLALKDELTTNEEG